MNMLEHTREFVLNDADRTSVDERSDLLAEALIDMEDGHADLLDSAVFVDLGKGTIGATVTISYEESYADAVKKADSILVEAIASIGDYLREADAMPPADGIVIRDAVGPRSLAVA